MHPKATGHLQSLMAKTILSKTLVGSPCQIEKHHLPEMNKVTTHAAAASSCGRATTSDRNMYVGNPNPKQENLQTYLHGVRSARQRYPCGEPYQLKMLGHIGDLLDHDFLLKLNHAHGG
jgi:hypothetical protein